MFAAPLLPYLTDTPEQIAALVAELADAGATGVSGIGLHLRPGAREWFFGWLSRNRPDLVEPYQRLYSRGANLPVEYRRELSARIKAACADAGLGTDGGKALSGEDQSRCGECPVIGMPRSRAAACPRRERGDRTGAGFGAVAVLSDRSGGRAGRAGDQPRFDNWSSSQSNIRRWVSARPIGSQWRFAPSARVNSTISFLPASRSNSCRD